jgi:hypothetical protein
VINASINEIGGSLSLLRTMFMFCWRDGSRREGRIFESFFISFVSVVDDGVVVSFFFWANSSSKFTALNVIVESSN